MEGNLDPLQPLQESFRATQPARGRILETRSKTAAPRGLSGKTEGSKIMRLVIKQLQLLKAK